MHLRKVGVGDHTNSGRNGDMCLRWFGHMERRPSNDSARRCETIRMPCPKEKAKKVIGGDYKE